MKSPFFPGLGGLIEAHKKLQALNCLGFRIVRILAGQKGKFLLYFVPENRTHNKLLCTHTQRFQVHISRNMLLCWVRRDGKREVEKSD